MNDFYETPYIHKKITKLSEYYKFHQEVPRYFKKPAHSVLNDFHNVKRKQKYYEIKRMMGEEVESSDDSDSEDEKEEESFKSFEFLNELKPKDTFI